MALSYLLSPEFQISVTSGRPDTGGWIETFLAGSRTKYITACDFNGTKNPFRIPLDSLGQAVVLAEDDRLYDIFVYNRYGTLLFSRYNVATAGGGGGEPVTNKRCVHRLLRYFTNAGDADAEHPVGDWLHDLDADDPDDPSGHPMVSADNLFDWLNDGQTFVLYEVDSQGGIEKWNAPYQLSTWQDQSEWWSQYAPEPGKAVRIEFTRLGAYSTPYRANMIAYIRYKDEDYMRLYEVKSGQSVWTAEYQEKLPYYSSNWHNGDYLKVKNDGSGLEWSAVNVPTATSQLTNDSGFITSSDIPSQVQSNWTQSDSTAVDFIRNKRAFKTFVTSYDYPDCKDVRNPGANTKVLVYYPYEDRKKVLFVNGRVYNLHITTSGILPQDDTIEAITARLFTLGADRQPKYLCPAYTFKAGNSVQFDLHWEASGVYSISEAYLDECAPHIEFDCYLKANTDFTIYCNGLEWFLNENVAI